MTSVVIKDVTIIAPPAPPRPHATVITDGARIASVQDASDAVAAASATVVEASGSYLIPGLTDMHVHFHRDDAVNRVLAPLLLAHGITTAYCMHGMASVLRLREATANGTVLGPRVLSAGPIQNDGGLTFALGRRRAQSQFRQGFNAIKVYNNLSRQGFDGLSSAARDLGMPVVGHVVRALGTAQTLGSAQSLIAHAEEFVYDYFDFNLFSPDPREADKLDRSKLPGLAAAAGQAGLTLVATLQHFAAIIGQAADVGRWMSQPEMSLLPARATAPWQPGRNRYAGRPFDADRMREAAAFQGELVSAFHDAGVPVLVGTDALATGSVHGVSFHRELGLFAAAGLPPARVLEAATVRAAAFIGTEPAGIAPGAPADLVLVSGNPATDITAAKRLVGLVAAGRWLTAEQIWAEHAAALAACDGRSGEILPDRAE